MNIKNVVFDVGNVLIDFRYKDLMRDLGFSEETVEFLSKNMVETDFWNELDRGVKFNRDGIEEFTKKFPEYTKEIVLFWENVDKIVTEFDYAEKLFMDLKKAGYGVYVLSNYPVETYHMHWPTFKFLPHADGYIVSGLENVIKPEEAIFRLLESRYGIKLEESVFVDDRKINTDAAESYGMSTILFTGYNELLDSFKNYGINI